MAQDEEEKIGQTWKAFKQTAAFNGGFDRESMVQLFGYMDDWRSRLQDVERIAARSRDVSARNEAEISYLQTVIIEGDRALGPGVLQRLEMIQNSSDEQQKTLEMMQKLSNDQRESIRMITRKVDEGEAINKRNHRELSIQLRLLILVFVLLFVLLAFWIAVIYL